MNFKKYLVYGIAALSLGMTSCVGDLDLAPIDPNKIFADTDNPEFIDNSFAECYAMLGLSGVGGPGDANLSAPDAGASVYNRVLFHMTELPADEGFWIWEDNGLREMTTNTFSASNKQIEVCYSRLYQHMVICNSFLDVTSEKASDPEMAQKRDEVRALRAMTYYWLLDVFGNIGFTTEAPDGTAPKQISRAELYNWLEAELTDLVDNGQLATVPVYGRVGKDAAEGLLCRLLANAKVYGGVDRYAECLKRCNNIINRHKGGGFQSSGLANNYLHLFCATNDVYMPGGAKQAENEILWGVPFDATHMQSYGGTTYFIAASLSAGDFGLQASWSCMTAREQLSRRFEAEPQDVRWSLWITSGRNIENETFLNYDVAGYQPIKWTNWPADDATGDFDRTANAAPFSNADLAMIRLADIYLLKAECYILGGKGDANEALDAINVVRRRAGISDLTMAQFNENTLLDERSRELYFELTRRSDLIRFGKYIGAGQETWSWKGNTAKGTTISERNLLMPIPTNIIAAQPELVQNPGY